MVGLLAIYWDCRWGIAVGSRDNAAAIAVSSWLTVSYTPSVLGQRTSGSALVLAIGSSVPLMAQCPLSKRDGLSEHLLPDAWAQAFLGHDVDLTPEELLQLRKESTKVQHADLGSRLHKEVNIAGVVSLPTGHGTKHAYLPKTVPGAEGKHLASFQLKSCFLIHGPVSRLSPFYGAKTASSTGRC